MAPPRTKSKPKLELTIWKIEGKLYFADRSEVEEQIKKVNRTGDEIKRRMGAGYALLEDLKNGKGITGFQAQHVETGIKEEKKVEAPNHNWESLVKGVPGVDLPPNKYEERPF